MPFLFVSKKKFASRSVMTISINVNFTIYLCIVQDTVVSNEAKICSCWSLMVPHYFMLKLSWIVEYDGENTSGKDVSSRNMTVPF